MLLRDGRFALGIAIGAVVGSLLVILLDESLSGSFADRAIIGAIVGGILSGLAGLAATVISLLNSEKLQREELSLREQSAILSVTVKLQKLRDALMKSYRHYYDSTPHLRMRLSETEELTKPLHNSNSNLAFSDAERAIFLLIREAELFNRVLDAEEIADALNFHNDLCIRTFDELQADMFENNDLQIMGFQVSGDVRVNKLMLMKAMDSQNLMRSFLLRTHRETAETHNRLLALVNSRYGKRLEFREAADVAPQSPNYFTDRTP